MMNIDSEIEQAESLISDIDNRGDVYYCRDQYGQWGEWRDQWSSARARLVSLQSVLFAVKEGF